MPHCPTHAVGWGDRDETCWMPDCTESKAGPVPVDGATSVGTLSRGPVYREDVA